MHIVNPKRYLLTHTLGVLITNYLQTGRHSEEGQRESLEQICSVVAQLGLGFTRAGLGESLRSLTDSQGNLDTERIEELDREILSAIGHTWRDAMLKTSFELGRAFGYLVFVDLDRLVTSDQIALDGFHTMIMTVVSKSQELELPREIQESLEVLDNSIRSRHLRGDERSQLDELNEKIGTYLLSYSPHPVILHLSDLHFTRAEPKPSPGCLSPSELRDILISIRNDLLEGHHREGRPLPNLLVISGDLTYAADPEDYTLLKDELGQFVVTLSQLTEAEHLEAVFVPGNHDISWPLASISHTAPVYECYKYVPFLEFCNRTLKEYPISLPFSTDRLSVCQVFDKWSLIIVALNSCVPVTDVDKGALIDTRDLDSAILYINRVKQQQPDVKYTVIAVSHHGSLPQIPGALDFIHNEEVVFERLFGAGCKLFLHGHVHAAMGGRIGQVNRNIFALGVGPLSPLTPGASVQNPVSRSYNLISIDMQRTEVTIYTRMYLHPNWIPYPIWDGSATYHYVFEQE